MCVIWLLKCLIFFPKLGDSAAAEPFYFANKSGCEGALASQVNALDSGSSGPVLRQNTLLSESFSPPRSINEHLQI